MKSRNQFVPFHHCTKVELILNTNFFASPKLFNIEAIIISIYGSYL